MPSTGNGTLGTGLPRDGCRARTWHLSLAYDGTAFHGWQIQPVQRTVQGELQKRIRLLFRDDSIRVAGCSRTDAGVHALDQQAGFRAKTPADLTAERIGEILNRWLPADVIVKQVAERPEEFNVRYANVGKAYTYVIHRGPGANPLFSRFLWRIGRSLDIAAMRAAAVHFVGERDFSSFAVNPGREIDSHVRRLHRVDVIPVDDLICISVVGTSFLYRMVRSIVGWLVHVGQGKAAPERTAAVLAARDRGAAADSAPPQGLFLAEVFFNPDEVMAYRPLLPPFRWQP